MIVGIFVKDVRLSKRAKSMSEPYLQIKNPLFKQVAFVDESKHFYTDLINLLIEDDKDKPHVFNKNGLYLATKKIGKYNPKAEQIKGRDDRPYHNNSLIHTHKWTRLF